MTELDKKRALNQGQFDVGLQKTIAIEALTPVILNHMRNVWHQSSRIALPEHCNGFDAFPAEDLNLLKTRFCCNLMLKWNVLMEWLLLTTISVDIKRISTVGLILR